MSKEPDRAQSISQGDIRPDRFTAGKLQALEADLDWLRARKSKFIKVKCPACDSAAARPAFEKYSFSFSECLGCETVYMSPRATPELMGEFYANSKLYEYWDKYIFPASKDVRREKIARPRVEKIIALCKQYDVSRSCLVEVGAGYGTFCEEAVSSAAFKNVIAVEPGSALAATCRSAGLTVVEAPIEKVAAFEVAPTIISCFEVIEHLFSPYDFLKKCHELLAPGGMIVITCPNMKGFDLAALRQISESTDAEHVNLFNPASLSKLFERTGFRVLEYQTPGYLDAELVREKVLAGEFSLAGQPFLQSVLIDRWDELGSSFQTFLRESGLSSHLWIVGQKAS